MRHDVLIVGGGHAFYRVIALDCVNAMRDYVQGRALVVDGTRIDRSILTNMSLPLKEASSRERAA